MNFTDRHKLPADSEGYETHDDATAHGMCEDSEVKCIPIGVLAEATGVVDDKIREALDALQEAVRLSEKSYSDLSAMRFKVDVSWACSDAGEPILAITHQDHPYKVDLRAIPFQSLTQTDLLGLSAHLADMSEKCREAASGKGAE